MRPIVRRVWRPSEFRTLREGLSLTTLQISPDQLIQSHTPLQHEMGDLQSKPVLVIGGKGDNGRKIAES